MVDSVMGEWQTWGLGSTGDGETGGMGRRSAEVMERYVQHAVRIVHSIVTILSATEPITS